jgi:hypothetical protein
MLFRGYETCFTNRDAAEAASAAGVQHRLYFHKITFLYTSIIIETLIQWDPESRNPCYVSTGEVLLKVILLPATVADVNEIKFHQALHVHPEKEIQW